MRRLRAEVQRSPHTRPLWHRRPLTWPYCLARHSLALKLGARPHKGQHPLPTFSWGFP